MIARHLSQLFFQRRSVMLPKGSTSRAITVMLLGTGGSQLVSVLVMIILARIYSPTDFGMFAVIQAIVGILTVISTLRYELAIPLPKSAVAAKVLYRLSSYANLWFSTSASILLLIFTVLTGDQFSKFWLFSAGVITYLTAQIQINQFWLTRKKEFELIAFNRMLAAVTTGVFQVLLAFIIGGYIGLLIGLLLGQFVALLHVFWKTPELRKKIEPNAPTKTQMAKRYQKMPYLNGPNTLLDSLRVSGIEILIARIALEGLGQYSLAFRLTMAPVSLINGAISQVLIQKFTSIVPGEMVSFLKKSFVQILILALPAFTVVYFAAPILVPMIFGAQWLEAGLIMQALIPWALLMTLTSPMSSLFIVLEAQEWALGFAILYAACPIVFLLSTQLSLVSAINYLALIMSALLLAWLIMAFIFASRFDRPSRVVKQQS